MATRWTYWRHRQHLTTRRLEVTSSPIWTWRHLANSTARRLVTTMITWMWRDLLSPTTRHLRRHHPSVITRYLAMASTWRHQWANRSTGCHSFTTAHAVGGRRTFQFDFRMVGRRPTPTPRRRRCHCYRCLASRSPLLPRSRAGKLEAATACRAFSSTSHIKERQLTKPNACWALPVFSNHFPIENIRARQCMANISMFQTAAVIFSILRHSQTRAARKQYTMLFVTSSYGRTSANGDQEPVH